MKDTRFIELVNLYIDRQISPDETAELEAELQSHPRRRQIYQQYCHMHRATKLVYESFRTHADQGADAPTGSSTIARFESRQRAVLRTRWMYAMGGLAAAACIAFAVVRHGSFPRGEAGAAEQGVLPRATEVATAQPAHAPVTTAPHAEVNSQQPSRATEQDYAKMVAMMSQEDQRAFAIKPLFDDGVFEAKQGSPADARRVFQNKQRQQAAEFTAFQFQR